MTKCALPPRSVTYVTVNAKSSYGGTCMISPLETSPLLCEQPGILVPNILTCERERLRLPVVNETSVKVTLKKGLPIGLLEHVCSAEASAIQTVETESPSDKVTGNAPVKEAKLDHMPSYQEKALRKLLDQYEEIFSKGDHDLGKTNVVTLKLDTSDHPPIKQRPYKTPFAEKPKVDQHINDMLEAGVISPSNSPWASPIVIVPKKDGTKRVCVEKE